MPSPAIFINIQNLTLNKDRSSKYSAIRFDFSTNINKSTPLPINVKLYKADWDSSLGLLTFHSQATSCSAGSDS